MRKTALYDDSNIDFADVLANFKWPSGYSFATVPAASPSPDTSTAGVTDMVQEDRPPTSGNSSSMVSSRATGNRFSSAEVVDVDSIVIPSSPIQPVIYGDCVRMTYAILAIVQAGREYGLEDIAVSLVST